MIALLYNVLGDILQHMLITLLFVINLVDTFVQALGEVAVILGAELIMLVEVFTHLLSQRVH
jgi:hypothetical protein